jgi:radical SAM protein with 4Fe4S-binding SPASM domain
MRRFLLREERGGQGYRFDRLTGKVQHVPSEAFATERAREDVDLLPLRQGGPRFARSVPFCVWFELTLRCNLHCIHCSVDANTRADARQLSAVEIAPLLDQFADFGIFEVRYSGGEPTWHPEYPEIVEETHRRGLFVSTSTNGAWGERRRPRLAALPVGLWIVSLDGRQQDHNALRPPGNSWAETVKTIRCLVDAGRRVRVNTVLCKTNHLGLREHVKTLVDLGAEALTLVPIRPSGRAARPELFQDLCLSPDEYQAVLHEVRALREEYGFEIAASYDLLARGRMFNTPAHFAKRCVAGAEAACIGPTGQLRACILLDDEKYVVGDLVGGEASLAEGWWNDARWGMFRNPESVPESCRDCRHLGVDCFGVCHVFRESPLAPDLPFCPLRAT